jgi:hypothetical protein
MMGSAYKADTGYTQQSGVAFTIARDPPKNCWKTIRTSAIKIEQHSKYKILIIEIILIFYLTKEI